MCSVSSKPATEANNEKHCCKHKQQQVGPREITRYRVLDESKEVTQKCAEGEQEAHPQRPVQTSCIHIALFAVDHPWNSKTIDAHSKSLGPERLLERHLCRAVFSQRIEDALAFLCFVNRNRN